MIKKLTHPDTASHIKHVKLSKKCYWDTAKKTSVIWPF